MSRRGENIRKRTDNRWEGRYVTICQGQKKTCSIYGKTYREVREKLQEAKQLAEIQISVASGTGPGLAFSQAAAEWLETVAASRKHATYIKYNSVYRKYLDGALGTMPIGKITPDTVNEYLSSLCTECSTGLKKNIYGVVDSILRYCSETYHIPLVRVKREYSQYEKRKIEVFNSDEQCKLLQVLYQDMDLSKMGIVLCLSTGLRLGELCALKWSDVDFKSKVLYVNRTVQRIEQQGQKEKTILLEGAPKTACSKREIPLSEEILELLQKFLHSGCYIFNGDRPMEPRTYQYRFNYYQKQADVTIKHFHVLRHTFATNCVTNHIDVKSLSEILGHSNVQITLNRYVHPTIDTKRKYMNEISAIYGQIVGQVM